MIKQYSVLALLFISLLFLDAFGSTKYCSFSCLQNYDGVYFNWLVFLIINFFLILLTTLLKNKSFIVWWSFAKYAIPIVFVLSTFISAGFHHNPNGKWQDIFDIPALFTIYGIFIIGSLIQIFRGYFSKSN